MITTIWTAIVAALGAKGVRILKIIVIALVVIGIAFAFGRCSDRSGDIAKQVEQTNRSAEAFTDAVENATARISEQTATNTAIDHAVEQVKDDIGHAKSTDDIRRALLDSLCGQASHRDDPACSVRETHTP